MKFTIDKSFIKRLCRRNCKQIFFCYLNQNLQKYNSMISNDDNSISPPLVKFSKLRRKYKDKNNRLFSLFLSSFLFLSYSLGSSFPLSFRVFFFLFFSFLLFSFNIFLTLLCLFFISSLFYSLFISFLLCIFIYFLLFHFFSL